MIARRVGVGVLCLALLVPLGPALAADPIVIGDVLATTGPYEHYGQEEITIVPKVIEKINAAGGVLGRPLKYIYQDSQANPPVARAACERMVKQEKVTVLLAGSTGADALYACAKVAEEANIPILITMDPTQFLTQKNLAYVFRVSGVTDQKTSGYHIDFAEDLFHQKSGLNVAIAQYDTAWAREMTKYAKQVAESRGHHVVFYSAYDPAAIDLKPMLLKIKATNPDVFLAYSAYKDAELMLRQMKEIGFAPKAFIGTSGWTSPKLEATLGKDVEGLLSYNFWSKDMPYSKDVVAAWRAITGQDPDHHVAEAYASVEIVVDALKRAGTTDGAKLREALTKTNVVTAFGPVQFKNWADFKSQNEYNRIMDQVQNGSRVFVWPSDIAKAKPIFPFVPWDKR
jgi:branched-chain amino acid transport system substrate-binding protein